MRILSLIRGPAAGAGRFGHRDGWCGISSGDGIVRRRGARAPVGCRPRPGERPARTGTGCHAAERGARDAATAGAEPPAGSDVATGGTGVPTGHVFLAIRSCASARKAAVDIAPRSSPGALADRDLARRRPRGSRRRACRARARSSPGGSWPRSCRGRGRPRRAGRPRRSCAATSFAYASCAPVIGSTRACTGASQRGTSRRGARSSTRDHALHRAEDRAVEHARGRACSRPGRCTRARSARASRSRPGRCRTARCGRSRRSGGTRSWGRRRRPRPGRSRTARPCDCERVRERALGLVPVRVVADALLRAASRRARRRCDMSKPIAG